MILAERIFSQSARPAAVVSIVTPLHIFASWPILPGWGMQTRPVTANTAHKHSYRNPLYDTVPQLCASRHGQEEEAQGWSSPPHASGEGLVGMSGGGGFVHHVGSFELPTPSTLPVSDVFRRYGGEARGDNGGDDGGEASGGSERDFRV